MGVRSLSNPSTVVIDGTLCFNNTTSNAPQAVATGTAAILIPGGQSTIRITAAAATTGATLPQGSFDGQILIIKISTAAANTVTFASKATSFVAGGVATSLAGLCAHYFVWDAIDALWYQVGPLTN